MKFTLGEVYRITRSLPILTDKELPIKVSYRLLKFLKSCSAEMGPLEESRTKLVEKYSEPTQDIRDLKVKDENLDKFQTEFTALLDEEVEIDFNPLSIDDLGDISVSAKDLAPLQKIFKG